MQLKKKKKIQYYFCSSCFPYRYRKKKKIVICYIMISRLLSLEYLYKRFLPWSRLVCLIPSKTATFLLTLKKSFINTTFYVILWVHTKIWTPCFPHILFLFLLLLLLFALKVLRGFPFFQIYTVIYFFYIDPSTEL